METKTMSEQAWAWLAGFMDGEGSFYPILEKRLANRSGFRMQTTISVANTSRVALERVIEIVGCGKLVLERRHNARHKPIWKITFGKRNTIAIIPKLLPHLINKREAAKFLLELAVKTSGRAKRYTQDDWNEIMRLYNAIRTVNRRGPTPFIPILASTIRPAEWAWLREDPRCTLTGCFDKHYGRGLCRKHYRRQFEHKQKLAV